MFWCAYRVSRAAGRLVLRDRADSPPSVYLLGCDEKRVAKGTKSTIAAKAVFGDDGNHVSLIRGEEILKLMSLQVAASPSRARNLHFFRTTRRYTLVARPGSLLDYAERLFPCSLALTRRVSR